jgi:predicted dehydrogenase
MANTRRTFLKTAATASLGLASLPHNESSAFPSGATVPQSAKNGSPSRTLRSGFIGTGSRCQEHINNVLAIPDNHIIAICDTQKGPLQRTLSHIEKLGHLQPKTYSGSEHAFEQMLNDDEYDCIIIASPWEWHVPMAVAAMKAGVPYVGVEVSAANTLEECWDLVNTAEATGSRLNILENVCYRRDCMAVLNMVRQGLFGELLHAQCGYRHDLRDVKFNDGTQYYHKEGGELRYGPTAYAEAQWRTQHSIRRNGDIYPTHGIGPVAHCLDINRGNRFISLTAMATPARGLHKFIIDNGGPEHPYANLRFNLGDIVTSLIKCANGQTVIVTHDTNLPRPYSLDFRIQGTDGLWMDEGNHLYIEGQSAKPHQWDDTRHWFERYDHSLWSVHEAEARQAGHGGMDYIMMYDLISAIRQERPAPMDCYDAAAWSAISALSEMSIARGGAPVDFPDFTRGQWIHRSPHFAC